MSPLFPQFKVTHKCAEPSALTSESVDLGFLQDSEGFRGWLWRQKDRFGGATPSLAGVENPGKARAGYTSLGQKPACARPPECKCQQLST